MSDKILLLCDVSAVYHYAATVNRDRTADDIEHRCLSGAITSYNGNKLSIIYFQIKIIKEAYCILAGLLFLQYEDSPCKALST